MNSKGATIMSTNERVTRLTTALAADCSTQMQAMEGRPCSNHNDHEVDACALRRIAMTLHRWHELECGDGNDYASRGIARGRKVRDGKERGAWHFEHDENGKPYIERHIHAENKPRYEAIPDRETGALKRLKAIMAKYPTLGYYVQTDPRGAPLYIIRPGDVPKGQPVDSFYNNGVAVYK